MRVRACDFAILVVTAWLSTPDICRVLVLNSWIGDSLSRNTSVWLFPCFSLRTIEQEVIHYAQAFLKTFTTIAIVMVSFRDIHFAEVTHSKRISIRFERAVTHV